VSYGNLTNLVPLKDISVFRPIEILIDEVSINTQISCEFKVKVISVKPTRQFDDSVGGIVGSYQVGK
jgi:hypothetical protein